VRPAGSPVGPAPDGPPRQVHHVRLGICSALRVRPSAAILCRSGSGAGPVGLGPRPARPAHCLERAPLGVRVQHSAGVGAPTCATGVEPRPHACGGPPPAPGPGRSPAFALLRCARGPFFAGVGSRPVGLGLGRARLGVVVRPRPVSCLDPRGSATGFGVRRSGCVCPAVVGVVFEFVQLRDRLELGHPACGVFRRCPARWLVRPFPLQASSPGTPLGRSAVPSAGPGPSPATPTRRAVRPSARRSAGSATPRSPACPIRAEQQSRTLSPPPAPRARPARRGVASGRRRPAPCCRCRPGARPPRRPARGRCRRGRRAGGSRR
jgi:hypothetical protein